MPKITRRDFVNGVAAMSIIPSFPLAANARGETQIYPPKLDKLRNGDAAFRAAHALAWGGEMPSAKSISDGGQYDLVIVGAGLSGLAAAWHFQRSNGMNKRVLLIDNNDDFGGHAQRNEFSVDGHELIASGGSDSIVRYEETWHENAKDLIESIGFDIEELRDSYDWAFYDEHRLTNGLYLSPEHFGSASLTRHFLDCKDEDDLKVILSEMAISDETREILFNVTTSKEKWYLEDAAEIVLGRLKNTSYLAFLKTHYRLNDEGARVLRNALAGVNGLGMDMISADLAAFAGFPGFGGLVKDLAFQGSPDKLYAAFLGAHFIDGNAAVARMFVRALRPEIVTPPGADMASIVRARVNYDKLDEEGASTRIRLKSTALQVAHTNSRGAVEVTYTDRDGKLSKVSAQHCILACWHQVIPYICPELDTPQKEALALQEKAPAVFVNVALRNWKPIAKSGFARIVAPESFFDFVNLERPIRLGGYNIPDNPAEPAVVSMMAYPTPAAEAGKTPRELLKLGRHLMYGLKFDDYEREIRSTLAGIWGPYGFDPDEHIAAITVNRWGHGYSYVYGMFDEHPPMSEEGPHQVASTQSHRISIANCDARAHADVGEALREAYRAVEEQMKLYA